LWTTNRRLLPGKSPLPVRYDDYLVRPQGVDVLQYVLRPDDDDQVVMREAGRRCCLQKHHRRV